MSSQKLCYTEIEKVVDVGAKMEDKNIHRHDISDEFWSKLEPLLPGRKGSWGGQAQDNRRFINAVFWILRTGAPWRDLPASYGGWKNTIADFAAGEIKASGRN